MTGDTGEFWNDVRKARQEKRADNREQSRKLLLEAGIPFQERNNGAHLIVADRFDFWPGTGKWIERGTKRYRRGVFSLIATARRK